MATIVCQGLQSCLESQVMESRTMRLRLPSQKPHFSQSLELALKHHLLDSNTQEQLGEKCMYEDKANFVHGRHTSSTPDIGAWSFLQALSNPCPNNESMKKENTYVHPLIKRSSSTLSEKSLELCTESLGSETGTDIVENSVFLLSPSSSAEVGDSQTRKQQKARQLLGAKKANVRSFPPPLTTMSGSESLHVRPHREDGRLIIEAIKTTSTHTYFHAERSNGRLKLSFVKDSTPNFDSKTVASTEYDEASNEASHENEDIEKDVSFVEEEEEEEEIEEEKIEELDGNKLDIEGEMEMEEFQRPSRCKEDELENKQRVLNWKPFLVATS